MTNISVLSIIINAGYQDDMINSLNFLKERLHRIKERKPEHAINYFDVRETHMIYINNVFRPVVPVAFEYQKLTVPGAKLGSEITFNIQQYGDYAHDMVFHLQLTGIQPLNTTPYPRPTTTGPTPVDILSNKVRFCEFPGHRVMELVTMLIDNTDIDRYDYNLPNFYYNYEVPEGQKDLWRRMAGETVPIEASYIQDWGLDQNTILEAPNRGMFGQESTVLINDGPQTEKNTQTVDLWMPLLFDFNRDPGRSISLLNLPSKMQIKIKLAQATDLIANISYSNLGVLLDGNPDPRTKTWDTAFTQPQVAACELYVNNIFMVKELQEITLRNILFQMIRVRNTQKKMLIQSTDHIKLTAMRWPTEMIYFGFRPQANFTGQAAKMQFWDRYHVVGQSSAYLDAATYNAFRNLVPPGGGLPLSTPIFQQSASFATWDTPADAVDNVSFSLMNVNWYDKIPVKFFTDYIPFSRSRLFSGPQDKGMMLVTMNIHPLEFQPSGHFNISRSAAEFYFDYVSSFIDQEHAAELIMIASAINFLLYESGSANLRYST